MRAGGQRAIGRATTKGTGRSVRFLSMEGAVRCVWSFRTRVRRAMVGSAWLVRHARAAIFGEPEHATADGATDGSRFGLLLGRDESLCSGWLAIAASKRNETKPVRGRSKRGRPGAPARNGDTRASYRSRPSFVLFRCLLDATRSSFCGGEERLCGTRIQSPMIRIDTLTPNPT